MEDRDTHFAGAAKALWKKISALQFEAISTLGSGEVSSGEDVAQKIRTLIAQYSYDLAYHILAHTSPSNLQYVKEVEGHPLAAPDLTEWPKRPEETS